MTNPRATKSAARRSLRVPHQVMGRTQDGSRRRSSTSCRSTRPTSIPPRSRCARRTPATTCRSPHRQRDVARAARRSLSRPHRASDGDDGALIRRRRPIAAGSSARSARTDYETTWRAMQAFTDARDAANARRDLAHRASADLHAGARRTARAPAARQRHPRASRSTAAGRSPITGRASSSPTCCSTCGARASASARWSGGSRAR